MAGIGPPRKHPSVRARANKTSTRATLSEQHEDDIDIPELPEGEWHSMTVAWWDDIWSSPMEAEWHSSDIHGLYRLAKLVDIYWTSTTLTEMMKVAAEIRLSSQPYGLSPLDRRRLEWQIEENDEKQARGKRRRDKDTPPATGQPQPEPGSDPRLHLVASSE